MKHHRFFRIQTGRIVAAAAIALFSHSSFALSFLNGVAIYKEFEQERFLAGLMLEEFSSDASQILTSDSDKEMRVKIVAERFSPARFIRSWIEGLAVNASSSDLSSQAENMAKFSKMLNVSMVKNDVISIRAVDEAVEVSIDGISLGKIEDPNFFKLLLRVWIGSVPLSSDFRGNLLAAGSVDEDLLARFNATQPAQARVDALSDIIDASKKKQIAAKAPAKPRQSSNKLGVVASISAPVIGAPPKEEPKKQAPPAKQTTSAPAQAAPVVEPENNGPKDVENTNLAENEPVELALADDTIALDTAEESVEFTAEQILARQKFISKIKRMVYKNIVYPNTSIARGESGSMRISVTIQKDGSLVSARFEEKTKYSRLNRAATRAIKKTEPFPYPENENNDEFSFSLPIQFSLD